MESKENLSKEESREKLIKAALKFFADKGFEGTTVRDIADDAGVNLSLVSYYFQGKLGLYRACIEEFGKGRQERAKQLLSQAPNSLEEFRIRLEMLVGEIVDFQIANPYPCQIVLREIDQGLPHAKDIFQNTLMTTFTLLVEFIGHAKTKGIVKESSDPAIVAGILQGACFHMGRMENVRKQFMNQTLADPQLKKRHVDQLIDLIMNGTTRGGTSS
jgi:TetR/AcrR family transcriptional regulator